MRACTLRMQSKSLLWLAWLIRGPLCNEQKIVYFFRGVAILVERSSRAQWAQSQNYPFPRLAGVL